MSSLLDPVGPLPRHVYWRRRLGLLAAVLLLLLVVARCAGGVSGGGDADAASTAGSVAAGQSSDDPDDGAAGDADEKRSGDGSSDSADSDSADSGSTDSGSDADSSDGADSERTRTKPPRCRDDQLEVTARPLHANHGTGSAVDIRFVVAVTGDADCRRDVGAAANEVVVRSGDRVVWSSDRCHPGGEPDVRRLGADEAYAVTVRWDGTVTPEGCPADRLPAPAGEYEVLGRNGAVTGASASLTLG